MTPVAHDQRPGLPALRYRVGTHGRFLSSMLAQLPRSEVIAPGSDNQTLEPFRPLLGLTTRDPSDPAIALLDVWATVADVLTFYQERIANEGYVRTATERRSLVELSRLVGYAPRPGVSSSVYLSYTLDDNQSEPIEIPVGTRSQSIPDPGDLPQSFETSAAFIARRDWNDLRVRRERPQRITLGSAETPGTVATMATLHVAGTETGLQPGDLLVFRFGDDDSNAVHWIRKVAKINVDFAAARTACALQALPGFVLPALPLLEELTIKLLPVAAHDSGSAIALLRARALLNTVRLGVYPPLASWLTAIGQTGNIDNAEAKALIEKFAFDIKHFQDRLPTADVNTISSPDAFTSALLAPPRTQVANAQRLRRTLNEAFAPGADLQPQLLIDFAPRMKRTYYTAWRGAQLESSPPSTQLASVHALRAGELLFGATVGRQPPIERGRIIAPPADWPEWGYETDEATNNAFLARTDEQLAAGDLVLLQQSSGLPGLSQIRTLARTTSVETAPRTAYGISADSTQIQFTKDWRTIEDVEGAKLPIDSLRRTRLYPQKTALSVVDQPILDAVSGSEIELAPLHDALQSGRWVIFEGERADIDGVDGVRTSELLMIAGLTHGYDPTLPGDRAHTTLRLATSTTYAYKRDTLRIHGNVVAASHGEARHEVLGNGDASKPMQHFELRQPPLTWRPAPTAAGAKSTLRVFVNDVEWKEVDSMAGLGAHDRVFVTRTDDADKTTALFGDGRSGMRPPTGFENLRAEYRNGIGKGGNIRAGQISLMVHRPLGAKEVINPLPASGGADREGPHLIRENAPLSIIALDRLVSVSDYADFTRMYAGIAKADAIRLSDGIGELVHITIAGVDDMLVAENSDLYRNLLASLRTLGDADLRLNVVMRDRVALVLQAGIRVSEGYRWEPVEAEARAVLLDRFGFDARALAQPALLCEVIATLQSVRGVDRVDVDAFGGIPESVASDRGGARTLITQDQITRYVSVIVGTGDNDANGLVSAPDTRIERPLKRVDANRAVYDRGVLRPAQLAIFTPSVPDSLILNPILDLARPPRAPS